MNEPGPSQGESPRDEQSETVHSPHPDPAPPERTRAPIAWITIGLAVLLLLAILLVVAAVQAS